MRRATSYLLLAFVFLIGATALCGYCVAQAQDLKGTPAVKEEPKAPLPKIDNNERLELRDLVMSGQLIGERVERMKSQITALQLQVEKMEPEIKKADEKFQAKWAELLKKYGQVAGETNINLETGEFLKVPKQAVK